MKTTGGSSGNFKLRAPPVSISIPTCMDAVLVGAIGCTGKICIAAE